MSGTNLGRVDGYFVSILWFSKLHPSCKCWKIASIRIGLLDAVQSELLCWEINHTKYQQTAICYGARCWWRSWLRHCATSLKVAGSIPDGVIGIFHWHNPSGRTMVLRLTQPLKEMSTRNISWGIKEAGADNLTTFMCRLSWNVGAWNSWKTQGLSRPVMGLLYLYLTICYT